jgi:hypothetical protein
LPCAAPGRSGRTESGPATNLYSSKLKCRLLYHQRGVRDSTAVPRQMSSLPRGAPRGFETVIHAGIAGASGQAARRSLTTRGSVAVLSCSRKILSLSIDAAVASSRKCPSIALLGTIRPIKTETGFPSGASNGMANFVRTNGAAGVVHRGGAVEWSRTTDLLITKQLLTVEASAFNSTCLGRTGGQLLVVIPRKTTL